MIKKIHLPAQIVLVVDDCDAVRRSLAQMLDRLGHNTVMASSGEHALEQLNQAKCATEPSMAVVDMQMPGLTGIETLCRIRERCPGMPVVFVSGRCRDVFASELKQLTGWEFLQKPLTTDRLATAIESLRNRFRSCP